jgi:hypothetical protein
MWKSITGCCEGIATVSLVLILASCATKSRAPRAPDTSYIDLEPDWRLRVVTPLLKSGGHELSLSQSEQRGAEVTIKTNADFIGYETAYYAIKPRFGHGVAIQFASAQVTKDGQTSAEVRPAVVLFQIPRSMRHVRLVYLERASESDHNMAVIAARRLQQVAALTRAVQTNPATACQSSTDAYCAWIPAGIAVRPEMRRAEEWAPVR